MCVRCAGSGDNSICVFEELQQQPSTSGEEECHSEFVLATQHKGAHSADVNCVRWHPQTRRCWHQQVMMGP